jgi:hypothetical protein
MAAVEGEIRVRQRPMVAAEQAVLGATAFAVPWVIIDDGWPAALVLLVVAVGLALVLREPAFVADADGIRSPRLWPWARRRHLRWDQVLGVRLVPGSFERPGRRIEIATVHGRVEVGAPRDGWLVRDDRLEGLVDQLWRRVPPAAPPARPMFYVDVRGVIVFARCAAFVVFGTVVLMATEQLLPGLLGVPLAFGCWLFAPRVDVDDQWLRASRGSRHGGWAVRWDEVRDVEVVTGRFGRRRIEVVGTERHQLPAPRDALVLRDPRIDDVVVELRSRIGLD